VLTRASQPEWAGAASEDARTIASLIRRGCLIASGEEGAPDRLILTDLGREVAGQPANLAPGSAATPEGASSAARPGAPGKIDRMIDLLSRPQGASIDDLMVATGWQAHSVRGAISGAIRKGRGVAVASEKTEAGRVYRVIAEETSNPG
jgi:hypothetical protein